MEQRMTDLENRIRAELRDPHWDLPTWPNPISRVRRAARLRLARLTVAAVIVIAVLLTPIAVARSIVGSHGSSRPSAAASPSAHNAKSHHGSVPSFAKRLGGEVAYNCQVSICLMRPDGTGQRTLLATFAEWDPAWSPNGRLLAFRGYFGPAEGSYGIYTVRANGCQLRRVPHGLQGANPTWSPTGRQIAFAAAGAAGIDIMNADGSGLRRLMRSRSTTADRPSWSARNLIAFVRHRGPGPGQIYTVRPDGTGLRQITNGPGSDQPSWSPSGQLIAFVTASGTIEVANWNGTGGHAVSPKQWKSSNPVWTPGGKVVFLVHNGSHISTYIVKPGGTDLRKLYPTLPAASPGPGQITWGAAPLEAEKCSPTS
jgi:hypothetical protein